MTMYVFPLSRFPLYSTTNTILSWLNYMSNTSCVLGNSNCLLFASTWIHPGCLRVRVAPLYSFLNCCWLFLLLVFILCLVCRMLPVLLDCLFLPFSLTFIYNLTLFSPYSYASFSMREIHFKLLYFMIYIYNILFVPASSNGIWQIY